MDLRMKLYIYINQACKFNSSSYHLGPVFFQARAKHDITNTAIAGCTTGGAISAKGNPLFHSYSVVYYVFITHNLYLRYDGHTWPGTPPMSCGSLIFPIKNQCRTTISD